MAEKSNMELASGEGFLAMLSHSERREREK
jgi:hypothetical protein